MLNPRGGYDAEAGYHPTFLLAHSSPILINGFLEYIPEYDVPVVTVGDMMNEPQMMWSK